MQYTYQDNTITFFEPISDNVLNLLPRLETTQVGKLQFNLPSFFSESLFELYINNLNDKKRILTYEDIIMLPHKYFDRYNEPEKLVEVVIKRYKRASESEKNEVLSDSTYKAEFLLKSTESEQYPTIRTTYVRDIKPIIETCNLYCIKVQFDNEQIVFFAKDGKLNIDHHYPELFNLVETEGLKKVLVRDNEYQEWKVRFLQSVITKEKVISWTVNVDVDEIKDILNDRECISNFDVSTWNYHKEIPYVSIQELWDKANLNPDEYRLINNLN